MNHNNLMTTLNNIFIEKLSQKDITSLITYCYSVSYTTWNNFSDEIISKNGLSVNDLAINSVVSLFSKNRNDKSKVETHLFEKRNKVKCEADLQFLLHKLVWERVEKDICWEKALADEKFQDVYLSLILLLRSGNYKRLYHFNNSFIVSSNGNQIDKSVIDIKSFNELPDYLFSRDLDKTIKEVLEYLKEKTIFFPAIPLLLLIKKLKVK